MLMQLLSPIPPLLIIPPIPLTLSLLVAFLSSSCVSLLSSIATPSYPTPPSNTPSQYPTAFVLLYVCVLCVCCVFWHVAPIDRLFTFSICARCQLTVMKIFISFIYLYILLALLLSHTSPWLLLLVLKCDVK